MPVLPVQRDFATRQDGKQDMRRISILLCVTGVAVIIACSALAQGTRQLPSDLPSDRAGTCLILCADSAKLATDVAQKTRCAVYCLDSDRNRVAAARKKLDAAGLYGTRVTVDIGKYDPLPYANYCGDVVLADQALISNWAELWRIAKPGGIVCISGATDEIKKRLEAAKIKSFEMLGSDGPWVKIKRLREEGMDEWTHLNHRADNNARGTDRLVKLPLRSQWINSRSAPACGVKAYSKLERTQLTAGGRLFHKREYNVANCIAAMDAYDGRLLWTYHQHPPDAEKLSPRGGGGGVKVGRHVYEHFGIKFDDYLKFRKSKNEEEKKQHVLWAAILRHDQITSPYVVTKDRVYVSHVLKKGCAMLDAATGKELATFVLPDKPERKGGSFAWQYMALDSERLYGAKRTVLAALDPATGKPVWHYKGKLAAQTIVVGNDNLMFFDYEKGPMALAKRTGEQRWHLPGEKDNVPLGYGGKPPKKGNIRHFPCVLYRNGVWMVYGGKGIQGFDEKDGRILWTYEPPKTTNKGRKVLDHGRYWFARFFCGYGEGLSLYYDGVGIVDPTTGKVLKPIRGSMSSCSRPGVTGDIVFPRNFGPVDLSTGKVSQKARIRNACGADPGMMGANGLVYISENGCGCHYMMTGNVTLAPAGDFKPGEAEANIETRFVKGPAFAALRRGTPAYGKGSGKGQADDWPAYRHDVERSGVTATRIAGEPVLKWSFSATGELTSPSVADGKVFFGTTANRVIALDAKTGKEKWRFLTGGPVTVTPTWHDGKVYAGCHDGWVYCLDAETGQLTWAFQGAPHERKIMVNDVLRSVWSINGGALVNDGKVYFYAGMMVMDGVYVYCLDAKTGKVVWAKREETHHPYGKLAASKDFLIVTGGATSPRAYKLKNGEAARDKFSFGGTDPVVVGDLLLCGGKRFDNKYQNALHGRRPYAAYTLPGSSPLCLHTRGRSLPSMLGGEGRSWEGRSFLFSTPVAHEGMIYQAGPKGVRAVSEEIVRANKSRGPLKDKAKWAVKWDAPEPDYDTSIPMIKAGSQIIAARPDSKSKSTLLSYDAETGAQKWELLLDGQAVENGLAAAHGCLYASMQNGKVLCLEGKK